MLTTAVPKTAILPAVVQVKAPVGIKTILPPPKEIGLGAVIVTIAVVPEMKVIGLVGAIVVADHASNNVQLWLALVAIVLATINMVGGFVVTDRMLEMFKAKKK